MNSLNITRQMIQDIKNFDFYTGIKKYKIVNKKEKNIIEKYFKIEDVYNDVYYYSLNDIKIVRKLKLLKFVDDKIYKCVEKIINKSNNITFQEFMENKLAEEIAKEIDTEILNNLLYKLKM